MDLPFRRCVVAVVINEIGQILVGERADAPGAWQLPQGGVDGDENDWQALQRELEEEVGCGEVILVRQLERAVSYDFPAHLQSKFAKKYRGQIQTWFLVKFVRDGKPDLSRADGEFRTTGWSSPEAVLSGIIEWKQQAYRTGLVGLGLLKE